MSNTNRQPGYYRVNYNGDPVIAEWSGEHWELIGVYGFKTDNEVKVTNPTSIDPNPAPQTAGEENIKYAFRDWLKNQQHVSFTVDTWNAYCAGFKCANEIASPQPAVQFTAEEMFHSVVTTERDKVDIISAMEQYAAQQTAHLEKLLSIALGKIETMKEDAVANSEPQPGQLTAAEIFLSSAAFPGSPCSYSIREITSAMEQYAAQQTAALREELGFRETQIRLLRKDVFYGVKEVGELHTQVNQKDARIKELETELNTYQSGGNDLLSQRAVLIEEIQEKDARIAELEKQLSEKYNQGYIAGQIDLANKQLYNEE